MQDQNTYSTSDYKEASYLRYRGIEISHTRNINPRQLLFVFVESEDREQMTEDFIFGKASGSISSYMNAVDEIKNIIKTDKFRRKTTYDRPKQETSGFNNSNNS